MKKLVVGFYSAAKCSKHKYLPLDTSKKPYISYEVHVPTRQMYGNRMDDHTMSIIGRGPTAKMAWNRAFQYVNSRIMEKLER